MVGWKAQGIEILMCSDDGVEGVVVFVGWRRENGLYDLAGYVDGVVLLQVQASWDIR